MAEDKIHFVKNSDLLDIAKKMKQDEEFNLSEKIEETHHFSETADVLLVSDIKEFIKRRTEKLIRVERMLCSNDTDDWDIALGLVRDLIKDKDKLAGDDLL